MPLEAVILLHCLATSWIPHPLPLPEFPRDGSIDSECQIDHEQMTVTLQGRVCAWGLSDLDRMAGRGGLKAAGRRHRPRTPGRHGLGPEWSSSGSRTLGLHQGNHRALSRLGTLLDKNPRIAADSSLQIAAPRAAHCPPITRCTANLRRRERINAKFKETAGGHHLIDQHQNGPRLQLSARTSAGEQLARWDESGGQGFVASLTTKTVCDSEHLHGGVARTRGGGGSSIPF